MHIHIKHGVGVSVMRVLRLLLFFGGCMAMTGIILYMLTPNRGQQIYLQHQQLAKKTAKPSKNPATNSTVMNLKPANVTLPKGCHIKPLKTLVEDNFWHVFHGVDHIIKVSSAYFDDRRGVAPNGAIRVFGLSSAPKHIPVFCQMWYNHSDTPDIIKAYVETIIYEIAIPSHTYSDYIYSCPLLSKPNLPDRISLTFEPCEDSSIHIRVSYTHQVAPAMKVGVCVVSPPEPDFDKNYLVEWIEMLKIFGVEEITVYATTLSDNMKTIFQFYAKKKFLRTFKAPPYPEGSNWLSHISNILSLNDCLYRNMYRYRYIIFLDFTGLIVPKKHTKYKDMFKNRLQTEITFRNAYFFPEIQNRSSVDNNESYLLSNTKRVEVSDPYHSVRSIFSASTCIYAVYSYCAKTLHNTRFANVDIDFGLVHNYIECHLGDGTCKKAMNVTYDDPQLLAWKEPLLDAISSVPLHRSYNIRPSHRQDAAGFAALNLMANP